MKTKKIGKTLLCALLLACLLLSVAPGGAVLAAAPRTVESQGELAFDPLAETQSVAYEQHEAGYAVTLDRAADSVTLTVDSAPASENARAAEHVRLYIRTGVVLAAGKTYRVGYALAAERAQADYTVCFDGAAAENAYGAPETRALTGPGTDRAELALTPEAEGGELVLRLLLGGTGKEGNVFTLSDLTVEEASADTQGEYRVLVDSLRYGAQGSITYWANDDCGAEMTADGESATLTVTKVPETGAEVWKIKLFARTGVRPEAGKAYRFSATVNASAGGTAEICYNEGDTEKGYGVLYNQPLKSGSQTFSRLIYIPRDRDNAGEIVFQLSLGLLKAGNQVTVSNVRVEEAIPRFENALPAKFSFNTTHDVVTVNAKELDVMNVGDIDRSDIDWGEVCVTKSGKNATNLTVDSSSATLTVKGNSDDAYYALLIIDTGLKLEKDASYLVQFTLEATQDYDTGSRSYNVLYGTAGNDKAYESSAVLYNGKLTTAEATTGKVIARVVKPDAEGGLVIRLELGKTEVDNEVTVSNLLVKKLGAVSGESIAEVKYAAPFICGNYKVREEAYAEITSSSSTSVTVKSKETLTADYWHRGFAIINVCHVVNYKEYTVSFDIQATNFDGTQKNVNYAVHFNRGINENDSATEGDGDGARLSDTVFTTTDDTPAFTKTFTPAHEAQLNLMIELNESTGNDSIVTVSNIKVNGALVMTGVTSPFKIDSSGGGGRIDPKEGGIEMTCYRDGDNTETLPIGDAWKRRLQIDNFCTLDPDSLYEVSFKIKSDKSNVPYQACYNIGEHFPEGAFGMKELILPEADYETVTYNMASASGGPLYLMLNVGAAGHDTHIWVKDISVKKYSTGPELTGGFGSSVWATFFEDAEGYMTRSSADKTATLTVTKPATKADRGNTAQIKLRTGVTAEAGKGYIVSYKITADEPMPNFSTIYLNGRADNNYEWSEPNFGGQYERSFSGSTTVSQSVIANSLYGGEITLQIELGNVPAEGNSFTISDVTVKSGDAGFPSKEVNREATTYNMQGGYKGTISRSKESVTLSIDKTPTSGLEAWKNKLFIDPDIYAGASEAFRVTMDVSAEQDLDFEVCYNRGDKEKGNDAVYDLHVAAGKTTTVERLFTTSGRGRLIVQLSLGKVAAPNAVTVRNFKVERVYFDRGDSALPAPIRYTAPGAFSLSAPHAGYVASLGGTDDSVVVNLAAAPAAGAEPWKVKLYANTGAVLQPGKNYRVSADITAKKAQRIEIAYNNGSEESGYDFLGLNVGAGETAETRSVISVPATKTDTKNLELQFNLGAATGPNEISIGGIRVEEVPLSYADALPEGFTYQSAAGVWVNPDCEATVESGEDYATIHVTAVPAGGAEVWKAKLLLHTGVYLQPGKVYQVRAALRGAKSQTYELCLNNEETESGFGVLYGQKLTAGSVNAVEHTITVPGNKYDAGELVLQFSVGGPSANDITVSGVSVQEVSYGGSGSVMPDTVIDQKQQSGTAAGTLAAERNGLSCRFDALSGSGVNNAVKLEGAVLRANELYTVSFTARAGRELTGGFTLVPAQGGEAAIAERFALSPEARTYSFTTPAPLGTGGEYDLRWQFAAPEGAAADGAEVTISDIKVLTPAESLQITRSPQHVVVNGDPVEPEAYNINGNNYFKLRDLGALLDGTYGQFVVRYNDSTRTVSLATGRPYVPAGGELTVGADNSATCVRSSQTVAVDGKSVSLKAYNIGGNNFFRLRDLNALLGFDVSYDEASNTVFITAPLTPEKQEENHAYDLFFLPEVDGETQPYVGDTMPFYDDGIYYIYYLKEGGDSYNHSVYVATTTNFVTYTEYDSPVLSASRADVQDAWIGTGSVVKAEGSYYFFYTGFNASGSQEYHEKIMVAKSDSPTAAFEKVAGWAITPPDELGQKNDFRDPQAYYDPRTQTFTLTVTASMGGKARVLKYTLDKDLQTVSYDGVIFTDPTGAFYNLECTDTFRLGDTWYLTYSGQEDTVWYARSDKQFGPYTDAQRLDGKLFYAAKHVENGGNTYLVGWTRRSLSASSVSEVSGWGGNLIAQKVVRQPDGSLLLVPADGIRNAFPNSKATALDGAGITLNAAEAPEYQAAFSAEESFLLRGQFQYTGSGAFGLAFDFNGTEEQYKLISLDPEAGKLSLSFGGGTTSIAETQVKLQPRQTYAFTYVQDGSVGIFYLDGEAALTVRVYGSTGKPICLFAENNSVTFSNLQEFVR